jgi:IclR family transcriptional regulator, KDG regulon repressor
MTFKAKRTYNITALQRGLRILDLFTQSEGGMSASQVAKLSGLPVSTVHRFLMNLESAAYLNSNGAGVFHLGIACFSLGQAARGQLDIRRLSLPYLQKLNTETRETVHLTVRFGLSAVYVEKLDSPEPLRIFSRIGAGVPLHCTGVGKAILAYMPESEFSKIIPQIEFKHLTPNSIGNRQELQIHLQKVRKNGYAFDLEENEPHVRCVAAPIWDHTGAVNASLSVTGPAVRMSLTRLRQLAPLVQEAGWGISRELGYQEKKISGRFDSEKTRASDPGPLTSISTLIK